MPSWNSAHRQYERAVEQRYKVKWLEKHRLILYCIILLPWFALVRILWWTAKVEVPPSVSALLVMAGILITELVSWWQCWSAEQHVREISNWGGAPRPRRRMRQSLRGALPGSRVPNTVDGIGRRELRSDDGEVYGSAKSQLNHQLGTGDGVKAPRPTRSKLFEPLTTPGKEDIQELTRGFADETNHQDADDGTNGPYHVMNEYDAETFRGVKFTYEQKNRYQASKPTRTPGFHQLRSEDLTPTSPTDLADFLHWMGLDYDTLQVWCQRFRQWASYTIVQKMDCEITTAYNHIAAISQSMGEQDVEVFPLNQVISLAEEKQEESWIRAKRECLQRELQQNPNDRTDLKKAYLQALENWDLLTSLLSCSWGAGLLPNTPRGYVGMRLKSMAVGSYMKGFQWSRPRQGQGGFFPEELPSDSEILLALFTAYLVTPGWNWRLMGERPPDSSGGPLYIGELPKYPAKKFSAVLSRPPRMASADAKAIIIRARSITGGLDPVFTIMVGGQLALNLSADRGVFQAIVLFLHYHRMHHDGKIGGRSLEVMDDVEDVFSTVSAAKVPRLFGKRDEFHY